ncbi:GreA/GreB family elongation factor [Paenibacillus thalictri]|uniref:GreA/GreB family elongation factor n=1 Tax=Paenibacillus thalictri TaxID=2527873 RepID=A0A4Q9DMN1_9BACL|nr:GreA/GreB family elongation factor [Paenibacillus thalictri]TBL76034.1 GreA/GreB family elongation factor [Paenibacillus thalictri]
MSHSFLLQGSRAQLIGQLVYFDEEIVPFLDQYFPGQDRQRSRVEKRITEYSALLERILADFHTESLNSAVLIGSQLELVYVEDGSTETYTIVFPHQTDPGNNRISFLSPMGLQLLLAQKNETCQLIVPSGELAVMIKDIKYMNRGSMDDELALG